MISSELVTAPLTNIETQILCYVADGNSNKKSLKSWTLANKQLNIMSVPFFVSLTLMIELMLLSWQ
jgi:hypothetical protein